MATIRFGHILFIILLFGTVKGYADNRFVNVRWVDNETVRPFFGNVPPIFEPNIAYNNGTLVFRVRSGFGGEPNVTFVIYDGDLETLIDDSVSIPEAAAPVQKLGNHAVFGDSVVFSARTDNWPDSGNLPNALYGWSEGTVAALADGTTSVFGFGNELRQLRNLHCDPMGCYVRADGWANFEARDGIWRLTETGWEFVLQEGQLTPDPNIQFEAANDFDVCNGNIVTEAIVRNIGATLEYSGIFTLIDGVFAERRVDGENLVSGQTYYDRFFDPVISGQNIAYYAVRNSNLDTALVAEINGETHFVREGENSDFSRLAIIPQGVLYTFQDGVYLWQDGIQHEIIPPDAILDGYEVAWHFFWELSVTTNQFATQVELNGSPNAIYVVTICNDIPPGDTNGDGHVNHNDVARFVETLLNPKTDDVQGLCGTDVNGDKRISGADVAGFVSLLAG